MAEITIRFRYDRNTGAREMVIHLESDADALPHEHERDHRAWAEQLIGQPLDEDITNVVVERAPPAGASSTETERESEVAPGRVAQTKKS